MFPSKLALPAAWLLLLATASAAPASETVTSQQATAAVTDTATGTGAAQPVPTNEKGASAFTVCHNTDGIFKPFCLPKHKEIYYPGSMHYVTWDTSFFPGHNTTLKVLGFYTNTTAAELGEQEEEVEAFSSDTIKAAWGFYQWPLTHSLLQSQSLDLVNITLRIVALPAEGQAAQWLTGPMITLMYKPKPPKKPAHTPTRADDDVLYIALPLVFGFATLMIVGTFCWNRQLRRIGVGSVMGRKGGSSRGGIMRKVGASKRDRARNADKEQGIRLMERDGGSTDTDEEEAGWDEGAGRRVFERVDRKRD
ncbi:hypothetical protein C8A01DRAFT_35946 [Parachaetomium inaequale]|uniref:Uncharacterized protein n=1 Tax=Parachaetomium inaequale TaxID=2588326 RepID=A0AAN6SS72_9PEZI|nr:hypothetical protein C8A01DRAFT_35946 [Parachaetomium inaequale]